MSQFTARFSIWFVLLLTGFGLISNFLNRTIVNMVQNATSSVLSIFIISIIITIINILFTLVAANISIQMTATRTCKTYPKNIDQWFKIFALILIGISILSSIKVFFNTLAIIHTAKEQINQFSSNFDFDELQSLSKFVNDLSITVVVSLILQNIIGILIIHFTVAKLKKSYETYI